MRWDPVRLRQVPRAPVAVAAAVLNVIGLVGAAGVVREHNVREQLVSARATAEAMRADLVEQAKTVSNLGGRLATVEQRVSETPDAAQIAASVRGSVFTVDAVDDIGSGFVFGDDTAVI